MEYFERVGNKRLLKIKGGLYVEPRLSNMSFLCCSDEDFIFYLSRHTFT